MGNSLIIVGSILLIIKLVVTLELCRSSLSIFPQIELWKKLEHQKINWLGKLILCILTVPFTFLYTIMMCVMYVVALILATMWVLFCLLFKKR